MVFVVAAALLNCTTPGKIPSGYLVNPRGLDTVTHGRWIFIVKSYKNDPGVPTEISGELIAVQNDTFYVLTPKTVIPVPTEVIRKASLIMFKDQSGKYFIATCLGLVPNIIAAFTGSAVYAIGIPFAIVGFGAVLIERSANTLRFPRKVRLSQFNEFARFPQGIPPGVDIRNLSLMANQVP